MFVRFGLCVSWHLKCRLSILNPKLWNPKPSQSKIYCAQKFQSSDIHTRGVKVSKYSKITKSLRCQACQRSDVAGTKLPSPQKTLVSFVVGRPFSIYPGATGPVSLHHQVLHASSHSCLLSVTMVWPMSWASYWLVLTIKLTDFY